MADDFFAVATALELTEYGTTPSNNPNASTLALYAKTDNNLYTKTSAGVETQLGAGGGAPPLIVLTGTTYTVATNSQVLIKKITIAGTGQIVVSGTGQLIGV